MGYKLTLSLGLLLQGGELCPLSARQKVGPEVGCAGAFWRAGQLLSLLWGEQSWWLLLGSLVMCKLLCLLLWQMAAPLPKIAPACCQLLAASFGPVGGSPAPTCLGVAQMGPAPMGWQGFDWRG